MFQMHRVAKILGIRAVDRKHTLVEKV